MRPHRIALVATLALVLPLSPARAGSGGEIRRNLAAAADALDEAAALARRSHPSCREAAVAPLRQLADRAEDLRREARPWEIVAVHAGASNALMAVEISGCQPRVAENVVRAMEGLERARALAAQDRSERDTKPRRRGERRQPDTSETGGPWGQLDPLIVVTSAPSGGEPVVIVSVPGLTLFDMRGQTFYLGVRFRSAAGPWSDWSTTDQWSVPSDPFLWKNALTHPLPFASLAPHDRAQGRFIAHVGVFAGDGRALAFREASFRVPQARQPPLPLPPRPPGYAGPPPGPPGTLVHGAVPVQPPGEAVLAYPPPPVRLAPAVAPPPPPSAPARPMPPPPVPPTSTAAPAQAGPQALQRPPPPVPPAPTAAPAQGGPQAPQRPTPGVAAPPPAAPQRAAPPPPGAPASPAAPGLAPTTSAPAAPPAASSPPEPPSSNVLPPPDAPSAGSAPQQPARSVGPATPSGRAPPPPPSRPRPPVSPPGG